MQALPARKIMEERVMKIFAFVFVLFFSVNSQAGIELFPVESGREMHIAVTINENTVDKITALQFGLSGVDERNFIGCTGDAFCSLSGGKLAVAYFDRENGLKNKEVLFQVVLKKDPNLKSSGKMEVGVFGNIQYLIGNEVRVTEAKLVY